jgi:fructose-bisphosphate aldolase class I
MRARIITSPAFSGERIIGAILFERTMDSLIDGLGAAEYLWQSKEVVPFLKVDRGLEAAENGVQRMKPIPDLDDLCRRALTHGVFGTKMRSVIQHAGREGVGAVVAQQFAFAKQILDHGLVPIVEPEVDIHSPTKADAETQLRDAIVAALDELDADRSVMLKLSLPETDNFYAPLVEHPRVVRVVALSGGYSREEANARLARNPGMVASFSRALTEGLNVGQSDAEFNAMLDRTIQSIYDASMA